jgi:hypothetical protein
MFSFTRCLRPNLCGSCIMTPKSLNIYMNAINVVAAINVVNILSFSNEISLYVCHNKKNHAKPRWFLLLHNLKYFIFHRVFFSFIFRVFFIMEANIIVKRGGINVLAARKAGINKEVELLWEKFALKEQ